MYIAIPIYSDGFLHPLHKDNRLSLLYVKELDGKGRMLTFNHMDSLSTDSYEFLKDEIILTPSKKYLLSIVYIGRTLASLAFIMLPITPISIVLFSMIMGSLWLATVPLTSGIVSHIYGLQYMGTLYGIVFLSHQVQ